MTNTSKNPLDYPILSQVKAIVALVAVIVGALVVSLPDAPWLKIVNGVVVAVSAYFATFHAKNAPTE